MSDIEAPLAGELSDSTPDYADQHLLTSSSRATPCIASKPSKEI